MTSREDSHSIVNRTILSYWEITKWLLWLVWYEKEKKITGLGIRGLTLLLHGCIVLRNHFTSVDLIFFIQQYWIMIKIICSGWFARVKIAVYYLSMILGKFSNVSGTVSSLSQSRLYYQLTGLLWGSAE